MLIASLDNNTASAITVYRMTPLLWLVVAVGLLLAIVSAFDALVFMVHRWEDSEEYGYAYLIPVITIFLIWQRKDKLEVLQFKGDWLGSILLILGVLIILIGQLSAIYTVSQYGFVVAVMGGVYAMVGWKAFRLVFAPLLLLFLMVPLPNFIFNNLSSQLQLISSQIGVAIIRLFDISVYLEGNVIDLGGYKLQVVEACSGLRYLFPLVALSIIASYFYQAAVWKRVIVVLSSMPITVLMNSFRIGAIGVLVENFGVEQADGFLHDFEGWFVFMACVALLVLEIWLLSFIGREHRPFREVFGMDFPVPTTSEAKIVKRTIQIQTLLVLVVLTMGAYGSAVLVGDRTDDVPERAEFVKFPMKIGVWNGRNDLLEKVVLDALKLDDYIIADYQNTQGQLVNFYVAYYGSQRSGASAHSPKSCLPGGGWRIESHTRLQLDNGIWTNRIIIRMGEYRQLVYYWFKQRDRVITNEIAVKWYMLLDSLIRNRTDGALVRLTTLLEKGEDVSEADERLTSFANEVSGFLSDYIPD